MLEHCGVLWICLRKPRDLTQIVEKTWSIFFISSKKYSDHSQIQIPSPGTGGEAGLASAGKLTVPVSWASLMSKLLIRSGTWYISHSTSNGWPPPRSGGGGVMYPERSLAPRKQRRNECFGTKYKTHENLKSQLQKTKIRANQTQNRLWHPV